MTVQRLIEAEAKSFFRNQYPGFGDVLAILTKHGYERLNPVTWAKRYEPRRGVMPWLQMRSSRVAKLTDDLYTVTVIFPSPYGGDEEEFYDYWYRKKVSAAELPGALDGVAVLADTPYSALAVREGYVDQAGFRPVKRIRGEASAGQIWHPDV